ncbi:MAG: SRPBCC domain-containing protein [Gammaproteobacteria bacterium]
MKLCYRALLAVNITLAIAWTVPVFAGNVIQTAQFPGLSPGILYNAYLSSAEHSAMTGYPATYYRPSTKSDVTVGVEGDELRAFGIPAAGGKLQYLIGGRILRLIPNREIVMTWKANAWSEGIKPAEIPNLESVLILTFRKTFAGAEIQLVQVNVPDFGTTDPATSEVTTETTTVNTNWYYRYWSPMTKYFQSHTRSLKSTSRGI